MRGKAHNETWHDGDEGDHPRVCGEKKPLKFRKVTTPGSPPRMRGKVAWYYVSGAAIGITPAYAGKSSTSNTRNIQIWDHPRVCGEKACGT